jgi:hypothetical protein
MMLRTFKGALTSSCPIHVHGRVEADLETPSLTVSATRHSTWQDQGWDVRSQGKLAGEFDADSGDSSCESDSQLVPPPTATTEDDESSKQAPRTHHRLAGRAAAGANRCRWPGVPALP